MHNINKLREIVKAQQGLLIPGGLLTLSDNTKLNNIPDSLPSTLNILTYSGYNLPNPYMSGQLYPKYINQGIDFLNNVLEIGNNYLGQYGSLTQAGNLLYSLISNSIKNPLVNFGLNSIGLFGNTLGKVGGKTDGMTKKDAIFNTNLGTALTFGINGFLGKKSDDFSLDLNTISKVGGSYLGSVNNFYDSAYKANKKYGLFSNKERKLANNQIAESKEQQNTMSEIASNAEDNFSSLLITDLNHIKYGLDLNGGIDKRYLRVAQKGDKILRIKKLKLHKLGGTIKESINLDTKLIENNPVEETPIVATEIEESIEEWYPTIILLEGGSIKPKIRTLEELIEYAKEQNPRFIQRMSEPIREIEFIDKEGNKVKGTHYLAWGTDDDGNAIVYPTIMEDDSGNLKYFGDDAYKRAIEKKDFLIMTPEEAELFSNSGEDKDGNLFGYKKGWPDFFKSKFKNGGKTKELEAPKIEETTLKNIIPEGALHARKHHMENSENLTQKGIPVIDNEGEQLAEIEKNEIIFTLEVTKKLEELMKEGTDEAAILAGKLLVKEILFNTDDRTNLIGSLKLGGIIDESK